MTESPERPGAPRQLDRAPGDRYRGTRPPADPKTAAQAPVAAGSVRRGVVAALGVAGVVAVARALLGQLDLGPGVLAIGAFAGWVVALAFVWGSAGLPVRRRGLVVAVLGGGAIVLGLVLESLVARTIGGVLGPVDYVAARYGWLAIAEIGLAAVVAGLRAR